MVVVNMPTDWTVLAIVAAVFGAAGWIKGVIGLGLPTIATGMLGLFMAPVQAASIVVLPALLTNVWQMLYGPGFVMLLRRLWPMLACVLIGTVPTAGIVSKGDVRVTVAALGVALIVYTLHALIGPNVRVSRGAEPLVGALAGLANGIISGTTGVFVVPTLPFLQAIDLSKDELVQAIGITAFTSAAALTLGLGVHGALRMEAVLPAGIAVISALAGMLVGQGVRARLSVEVFRRWVLIGLMGLGAIMVARAFF